MKPRLAITLATLLALIALIAGINFYLSGGGAQTEIAAYQRARLPWTAKDLQKSIDPKDNAAKPLQDAIREIPANYRGTRLFQNQTPLTGQDFQRFDNALHLAAVAAQKPYLDFNKDWDLGVITPTDDIDQTKLLITWLTARGQMKAAQKDKQGMREDLLAAWRLAKLIGQEPSKRAFTQSLDAEKDVLTALIACAPTLRGDRQTLNIFKQELRKDVPPSLTAALKGIAYEGLATLRNQELLEIRAGTRTEAKGHIQKEGLPPNPQDRLQAVRYLRLWIALAVEMSKHPTDQVALGKALDKTVERLNLNKGYRLPDFHRLGIDARNRDARVQVVRVYLESLLYEAQKGVFPEHVHDLPGAWPDVYGVNNIRIIRLLDSFRVWSVGPNARNDDGIVTLSPRLGKTADDIAATYPPERSGL